MTVCGKQLYTAQVTEQSVPLENLSLKWLRGSSVGVHSKTNIIANELKLGATPGTYQVSRLHDVWSFVQSN